jgi:uncharacterized membrane protein
MDQNNQAAPTPPAPSTPPPAGNAVPGKSVNVAMAIIAYILFFVPLLTGDAQKDEFVKFHVKQGLVIFIIGMAIWIVGMAIPWYWTPIHVLLSLCSLANLVLVILGIINAANKKKEPLPIVGKYADYFKF